MSNITEVVAGAKSPAAEVKVAPPTEVAKPMAGANNPSGIEVLHGTSPGNMVSVIIRPQAVVVDLERVVTIGGRPNNRETFLDLYNEGRKEAGLNAVTMEQLNGK